MALHRHVRNPTAPTYFTLEKIIQVIMKISIIVFIANADLKRKSGRCFCRKVNLWRSSWVWKMRSKKICRHRTKVYNVIRKCTQIFIGTSNDLHTYVCVQQQQKIILLADFKYATYIHMQLNKKSTKRMNIKM